MTQPVPDPSSLLPLANKWLLRPAVKRLDRFWAERRVAQGGAIPDLLEENLKITLERLQRGGLTEPLWRQLITPLLRPEAPLHRLEHHAVRKWLSDPRVGDDLIALAKATLLKSPSPDPDVHQRLTAGYLKRTDADPQSTAQIIDLVVAVMLAGFLASIPEDQKPLAALIRALAEQIHARDIDPITRATHTKCATVELRSILSTRDFGHLHPEEDMQALLKRVTDGNLFATDTKTTERIRYWTARLCASSQATLDVARNRRSEITVDRLPLDVTIVDALIAETAGNPDLALRTLRDPTSPDQRASLFGILVRIRGNADALKWFFERDHAESVNFFTALGWRDWGLAMARTGKWSEAADHLARFEQPWQDAPGLALIEGFINAAMLLPDQYQRRALGCAPLYQGICLHHRDGSTRYHARAVECFGAVRDHPACQNDCRIQEEVRTWLTWLGLMNPDPTQEHIARDAVENQLGIGSQAVSLAPHAWAFRIPYDKTALTECLRQHRQLGGLNPQEWRAECLMNHHSMLPRDFVDYLDSHRTELEEALSAETFALMKLYSLTADDQDEQAQAWLERSKDVLGELQTTRIVLTLKGGTGDDQRQRLETLYQKTQSLTDLRALLAHLETSKNEEALLPYVRELFKKERTVQNATWLALRLDSSRTRLQFLEDNSDLVHHSSDLKAMKAVALFSAGRFGEAKTLSQELRNTRDECADIYLSCHIAISTGSWENLPDLIEQAWTHRSALDTEQLIRFAHIAGGIDGTQRRAIQMARLAAERATATSDVLTTAYVLHTQLGRHREADFAWLKTAAEQSSSDSGPVWKMSPRSIVEEWLPQRRVHLQRTEEHLVAGEIPLSVVVEQRNTSLSSVFLHASKQDSTSMDGRNRRVLPIIAANKGDVNIGSNWTVGLDLTSVLVLEYLDRLRPTLDSLHKVALSADIFECLFIERRTVRFQQPILVQEAKQLLEYHRSEKIRPIVISQPISDQVSNEVGTTLAALLAEAQDTAGVVVCTRPIYRPDSMMEEEAATDDFEKLLLSPRDLFALLHQKRHLSLEDHSRAQKFASAPHGGSSPGIPASALDQPVYVDRLALRQIQSAGLLPALTSAVPDLRIHPTVLAEARALGAESDVGSTLAARIDEIRTTLQDAIQAGKAFQLHQALDDRAPPRAGHHAFNSTISLFGGAGSCNAVCIDDRSLNRYGGFLDSDGQAKPIVSVLDVLRALRDRQTITADEYWSARHRLRRGGFAFVLPERDELLYWLKRATIKGDHLMEGVELQTIRQDLARTAIRQITTAQEAVAMEPQLMAMTAKAMLDIWAEPEPVSHEIALRASYLWQYTMDLVSLTHTTLPPERLSDLLHELLVAKLMFLFLPRGLVSDELTATYGDWIEQEVLSRLLPANADLVRDALDAAYRDIRSSDEHLRESGHLFFVQLPERLQLDAIAKDPEFAHRCGFDTHQMILLGKEIRISVVDLARGVRSSFGTGSTEQITADDGQNIEIETSLREPYVTAHWTEGGKPRAANLSAFANFAPTAELRDAATDWIVNSRSRAFHEFSPLANSAKRRVPTPQEIESAIREATQGVNATQAALEHKLRSGARISRADIIPEQLDYFDRFAGPDPGKTAPEQYLLEILAPYRKNLIKRDLSRGLEICCLGTLRDDLCPGQWLSEVTDDEVWTELTAPPLQDAQSPFAILGILDVALYRLDDDRFLDLAGRKAVALVDDDMKRDDGVDIYRLLEILASLVRNRINLIEGGANRPGYWKRMCALMQAGWMCRIKGKTSAKPDMDSFESRARGQMPMAGEYASLVDARSEPLIEAHMIHANLLRDEVLRRLHLLQIRHEREGREVRRSDKLTVAFAMAAENQERGLEFPGPLELHQRRKSTIPTAILQDAEKARPAGLRPSRLEVMAIFSQRGVLAHKDLRRARSVVQKFGNDKKGESIANELAELTRASVIAAAHRDTHLADAVGEVLKRLSAKVASASAEIEVQQILRVALQSAAAYEAERDWSKWLETRLRSVAEALPGPPNKALGEFLALLREIEVVVPRKLWFHIPARTVALSGAA